MSVRLWECTGRFGELGGEGREQRRGDWGELFTFASMYNSPNGMAMITYKMWSEEVKYLIFMEGLSPRENVAEVCQRHEFSSTLFYRWRERTLAGMRARLTPREGTIDQRLRQQYPRLKRWVADQAVALEVFKEQLGGRLPRKRSGREVAMKLVHSGASSVRDAQRTGFSWKARYNLRSEGLVHHPRFEEQDLRSAIGLESRANPPFGPCGGRNWLRLDGRVVNPKRVHRLMKTGGRLKPAHFSPPRNPLARRLGAEFPIQKWSTDLAESLTTLKRDVIARLPKSGRADGQILNTDGGPQFDA